MTDPFVAQLGEALVRRLEAAVSAVGTPEAVHRLAAALDLQRLLHRAEEETLEPACDDEPAAHAADALATHHAYAVALGERALSAVTHAAEEPGAGTAALAREVLTGLRAASEPLVTGEPAVAGTLLGAVDTGGVDTGGVDTGGVDSEVVSGAEGGSTQIPAPRLAGRLAAFSAA